MDKDTTTIRIPKEVRSLMQEEADAMGISLNSYFLVAMNMGRKLLSSKVTVLLEPPECTSSE